jgi:acetylglutamate kinase
MQNNTRKPPLVVVKIGGRSFENEKVVCDLGREIKAFCPQMRFALVHGGGAAVTATSQKWGITPIFVNGIRMTTPEEMRVVDMVLAGELNKRIVRTFQSSGVPAVGLSGSDGAIFTAEPVCFPDGTPSCTGTVTETSPILLNMLLDNGFVPVIGSSSMTRDGGPMNVNADDAALAVAGSLCAHTLVFISDIPGVMKDGTPITHLSPSRAETEIVSGVILGGMIPKVRAASHAVRESIGTVIITDYHGFGDLDKILKGRKGTRIADE